MRSTFDAASGVRIAPAPVLGGSSSTLRTPSNAAFTIGSSGCAYKICRFESERDAFEAVALRIRATAPHQIVGAFQAEHRGAAARQRQREVADAAEQIEHPIAALDTQPVDRALDEIRS